MIVHVLSYHYALIKMLIFRSFACRHRCPFICTIYFFKRIRCSNAKWTLRCPLIIFYNWPSNKCRLISRMLYGLRYFGLRWVSLVILLRKLKTGEQFRFLNSNRSYGRIICNFKLCLILMSVCIIYLLQCGYHSMFFNETLSYWFLYQKRNGNLCLFKNGLLRIICPELTA